MSSYFNVLTAPSAKKALEAYKPDTDIGPGIIQQAITDCWTATFIYYFYSEDAHLRQSVIDLVCKHRPGENPRLGDPFNFGSYNFNIQIIFDDGIVLFRFPIPGVVVYPDDKVKAEVATIRYVADHTTIPVPHIYHWGTAAENPTRLHVPFIIMEHIHHTTTVGQALEDPDFKIPSVPQSEKREYLYRQMANISLQLYSLTSDRIGSLGILDNGEYGVTSAPLPHNIANHVVNCSAPVSVLPPRHRVYSSSTGYLTDAVDMHVAELLFMNKKFIESATDCRNKFVARYLIRNLVRGRQEAQTSHPREIFRLWGDDFRPENVLLDENGVVVGAVDWEYTYFAPETYYSNPPWWLLLEEGGDDFGEEWDRLVRTYLRALEKMEEKLQSDQKIRPVGNHLCSGSNKDQDVTTPIPQKLPLSQLMKFRWDEDPKEFALTTCMAQGFLLDRYFWDTIDRRNWGENAAGGYEARLELLNAPSRMLMEWFVHCRAEENQARDPKALLDQVLEQMDGKSSELVVQNDLGQD
ncbi:kinase-like domain-containing protein [Diaporthe sp. PMI_573]|nr:kinase-like domain-containing protein [Diaporthaceae sp. PMI_573]